MAEEGGEEEEVEKEKEEEEDVAMRAERGEAGLVSVLGQSLSRVPSGNYTILPSTAAR